MGMSNETNILNKEYNMSIHKIGAYRYASIQVSSIDKNTGCRISSHVHWGTVDENNIFTPNNRFILAPPEELKKFVFPENWNLCKVEEIFSTIKGKENIIFKRVPVKEKVKEKEVVTCDV